MKCSDLGSNLALFIDGSHDSGESGRILAHVDGCPQCHATLDEYRKLHKDLAKLTRPALPESLRQSLRRDALAELRSNGKPASILGGDMKEWLQMRVIPYGIGVFASVLIGFTFLAMMFSGMLQPTVQQSGKNNSETTIMLASNRGPTNENDYTQLSPAEFAQTRMGLGGESPSVNPQGALIALTRSLVRGGMKDEEVVVVADVFSNGLAKITDIVEPARDRESMNELERALTSDPAYAPFVTSSLDNRPENVRVVLRFQSVNVKTNLKGKKNRL